MGNEENQSSASKKTSNELSDNEDEENIEKKELEKNRSSLKIRTIHLNKEKYHGQTFGGIREGYGIYYYKNGNKYDGNWKDNKKEGKGSFFYSDKGEVYKGDFVNDLPNGKGIYYFKNGDRYEGMFKDGKKHGEGIIFYRNGDKYKGEFKNDLKHGKGEYKNKFGQIKYEYWENGVLKLKNEEKNNIINESESVNLFNETNTKKFDEFLKSTYRKKSVDKFPFLNKVKQIKEKGKNKMSDQQLVQILNIVKEKPKVKSWNVEDVKNLFQKINLEKYIPFIELNLIDGKKLLILDNASIYNFFKLTDKNEAKIIVSLIDFIGDISNNEHNEQDKNKIDNISNNNNNYNNNKTKNDEINNKIIINKNKSNIKIVEKEKKVKNEKKNHVKFDFSYDSENKDEIYIKEMNKLGKSEFYSSLNYDSLNYFINYDEIKKEKTIVGEGGMGSVSLGEWQGKQVALKKIKFNYNEKNNNFLLKKFINEINIISSMRHPNILLYMGTTVDEDNYYMITEYLPKGSLYEYLHIKKKFLTDKQKIKIAFQIAIAIQYIHSRNILHCDLKSSNVLLDQNFKIKLSDFGLSYFLSEVPKGMAFGTFHWMAPEILNDGKYEITADIFSYGMILWELLTNSTPYYNVFKNSLLNKETLKKYIDKKFANHEEIAPIPKDGNIVLRYIASECLKYKPEDRLNLDNIIKILSKAYKCYEEIDEVTLEMYNFVS